MNLQCAPELVRQSAYAGVRRWGDGVEAPRRLDRVLVVDDERMIRALVESVLRRADYHVNLAEDGESGWNALAAGQFDLLITDHEMPHLKGLDLVRRLRQSGFNGPIILMSGTMPWDAVDLEALLSPGLVLEKPFRPQDLVADVNSLLATPSVTGLSRSPFVGFGAAEVPHSAPRA